MGIPEFGIADSLLLPPIGPLNKSSKLFCGCWLAPPALGTMLDDCTPLLFKTSPSSKALFAVVTAWTLDPDDKGRSPRRSPRRSKDPALGAVLPMPTLEVSPPITELEGDEGVELVVPAVIPVDDVMVTEGTSTFSVIVHAMQM